MASKNPFIETFQQALVDAGYPAKVNGVWDRQTVENMQEFAEDYGFPKGNAPTAEIMALLEIHPSAWWTIASAAGAPQDLLTDISSKAKKQITLDLIEGQQQMVGQDKMQVSRGGSGMRTTSAGAGTTYARDSGRVPYTPEPTATRAPESGSARGMDRQRGGAADQMAPLPGEDSAPLAPLPAEKKKFEMPTWGWVAIGLGGAAVVATIAGVVIVKTRQTPPQMGPPMEGWGYRRGCY